MPDSPAELTTLLKRWGAGDREALDRMLPTLYAELRSLAHHRLRQERSGHTLNTTALVNEAYLRLVDIRAVAFRDRAHFLSMAARAMRRILVDYARVRNADKRGGGIPPATFDEELHVSGEYLGAVADLDEALHQLELVDERAARAIEHRYFAGLTADESAEVLNVSSATVKRDLRFARAWLANALEDRGELE